MQVLLIEPNHLLGRTYVQALEQGGHAVSWHKSAQAAVTAADSRRPDVVVLELQLVGHSGIEFLYEFRSYPDWQAIPIILQTFVPEENFALQKHHFQTFGVAAYLYKPATSLGQFIRAVGESVPVAI